jgi:hypothetical protein
MIGAVLVVVLAFSSHSRSEGTSRIVVGDNGHVDLRITMGTVDAPELCDTSLVLVDEARRALAEEKFSTCVEQGLARWLRLYSDDDACTIGPGSWRRQGNAAVELSAQAFCPPHAGHSLVVHWGLFQQSTLDHVSGMTVVLPDGSERRALLSRRQNRLVVDIPHRWSRPGIIAATIGSALLLAILILRRMRVPGPAQDTQE